ncbi:hypothetical protein BN1723_018752, partial [Verticillium longisporum]
GIRLAGTFGAYREAAADDTIIEDDGRRVEVKKGDRVFVSFVGAARDAAHFPNPEVADPRRPLGAYIHYGLGPHACLGREASQIPVGYSAADISANVWQAADYFNCGSDDARSDFWAFNDYSWCNTDF